MFRLRPSSYRQLLHSWFEALSTLFFLYVVSRVRFPLVRRVMGALWGPRAILGPSYNAVSKIVITLGNHCTAPPPPPAALPHAPICMESISGLGTE